MNAVDMLKYGDRTFRSAFSSIPDEQWEDGEVCGHWSVKNIVAHLTSFELVLGDVMAELLGEGLTPFLDELRRIGAKYNDAMVEQQQKLSSAETRAEYDIAHARLLDLASRISPETYRQNGTLPWYGADYCLDDLIVYINYAHKREHAAEINVFGDRFK